MPTPDTRYTPENSYFSANPASVAPIKTDIVSTENGSGTETATWSRQTCRKWDRSGLDGVWDNLRYYDAIGSPSGARMSTFILGF